MGALSRRVGGQLVAVVQHKQNSNTTRPATAAPRREITRSAQTDSTASLVSVTMKKAAGSDRKQPEDAIQKKDNSFVNSVATAAKNALATHVVRAVRHVMLHVRKIAVSRIELVSN